MPLSDDTLFVTISAVEASNMTLMLSITFTRATKLQHSRDILSRLSLPAGNLRLLHTSLVFEAKHSLWKCSGGQNDASYFVGSLFSEKIRTQKIAIMKVSELAPPSLGETELIISDFSWCANKKNGAKHTLCVHHNLFSSRNLFVWANFHVAVTGMSCT